MPGSVFRGLMCPTCGGNDGVWISRSLGHPGLLTVSFQDQCFREYRRSTSRWLHLDWNAVAVAGGGFCRAPGGGPEILVRIKSGGPGVLASMGGCTGRKKGGEWGSLFSRTSLGSESLAHGMRCRMEIGHTYGQGGEKKDDFDRRSERCVFVRALFSS